MTDDKWKKCLKYFILFITGYCLYIAIEITFRGYSYVLMGLVGAITFILNDRIQNVISWETDIILQGCIGSAMVTLFELVIGELYKFMNWAPMWDYSSVPLNFDGVICFPFSLIWIALSIVGIFISDSINYYMLHESPQPYYRILGYRFMLPKRSCEE